MEYFKKLNFIKTEPNSVSRIRKQAKSKYHKVVITDEANMDVTFMKYKTMTVFVADTMNSKDLIENLTIFLHDLKSSTKGKKIIVIFCCGYFNFLTRYSCSELPSSKCCRLCEFYMTNEDADVTFETVLSVGNVIKSAVPNAHYIPVPLPPLNLQCQIQQQLLSNHKSCCPHITESKIAEQLIDQKIITNFTKTSLDVQ